MRVGIINFTEVKPTSTIASNAIALCVHERFENAVLMDTPQRCTLAHQKGKPFDLLVVVNGVFGFCKFRQQVVDMVAAHERIVWAGNDFDLCPVPSQLQKVFREKKHLEYWCAYHMDTPCTGYPKGKYHYVNWNALAWKPLAHKQRKLCEGLMYYGAFRADRLPYFEKYLHPCSPYRIYCSPPSSKQAHKWFTFHGGMHFFNANPPAFLETLGSFRTSIYIEDTYTHEQFCSPANRFYELVSARVLVLFDVSCQNTFDTAGISIGDYLVNGSKDLNMMLKAAPSLLEKQQQDFATQRDKNPTPWETVLPC